MMIDDFAVQRALAAAGFYKGVLDGKWGPMSARALNAWVLTLPVKSASWPAARKRIAIEQQILKDLKFYLGAIDGLNGPSTQVGLERWQDYITFKRPTPNPAAGVHASMKWPRQKDMEAFYGKPGTNHTTIVPPYPVFYGGKKVAKITLNERCAESGLRILETVKKEYGEDRIHEFGLDIYGGSYNNRTMRNGASLSTHAYACAWDWDPARNGLRQTAATAQFAKPEYRAFIYAHEDEGWISLGRTRNMDYMHFQAARY